MNNPTTAYYIKPTLRFDKGRWKCSGNDKHAWASTPRLAFLVWRSLELGHTAIPLNCSFYLSADAA